MDVGAPEWYDLLFGAAGALLGAGVVWGRLTSRIADLEKAHNEEAEQADKKRTELQGDIRTLRNELRGNLRDVKEELRQDIRELRTLIIQQHNEGSR